MKRTTESAKLLIEKSVALATAVLLMCLYWFLLRKLQLTRDLKDLVQAALNVSAIAVGFLVSAKAILLSISRSRVVRGLQRSGHYVPLIRYFLSATWWSVIAALASASLLWLDLTLIGPHKQVAVTIWLFFCGGSIGATARVVWLFGKLVKKSAEESDADV